MSWIAAALIMFASSVVLYLLIRRASLAHLPAYFNNLAGFSIPLLFFAVGSMVAGVSLRVSLSQAGLCLLAGAFAYIANRASLKSIEIAPNPGYSLIISKSYVVLTTFLAVPLLGAHLSFKALLAILLIVSFSGLIMFSPKGAKKVASNAWLRLAFVAFFGWAFLSLVAKYSFTHGLATLTFLTWFYAVVTVCIFWEMYRKKADYQILRRQWASLVCIGLASTSFNFFNFYAINLAPNVGYVNATNAASIGAVTIFAALLFKDELSVRKLVGVVGVIASLFLLFLG